MVWIAIPSLYHLSCCCEQPFYIAHMSVKYCLIAYRSVSNCAYYWCSLDSLEFNMYTTFILDEVGNRKIIMDWRGSPPFDWNEVKVADLLSQYPNHCAGLTFGYFWTGDDWHPQQNRIVSPVIPSIKVQTCPAQNTFGRTGPHTRKSEDRSPEHSLLKLKIKPVTR